MRTIDVARLRFESLSTAFEAQLNSGGPIFVQASFNISEAAADTFMSMNGWYKGVVWVNGFNLGRYWTAAGPQRTLYLPAPLLRAGCNTLIILELQPQLQLPDVQLVDVPDFGDVKGR